VWLPDSMEGPTPISALIHAATMVTAGIFMVARMSPLFELSDTALSFVTVIGATTALFMAILGIVQNDIKRVVAYSTLSQLGYMACALGASAYSAAIFHLMTHAFFKALLFLGAGSVIHAIGGEQDMRRMGGLRKKIPVTFWVMTVATFAIAGFPPLAAFFSKDEILTGVYDSPHAGHFLWAIGVITAGLTSFYMFRLWFMTFFGEYKPDADLGDAHLAAAAPAAHASPGDAHDDHGHGHAGVHESPWIMLAPLVILAVLSFVGGWVNVPRFLSGHNHFDRFLAPVMESTKTAGGEGAAVTEGAEPPSQPEVKTSTEWALTASSVAAGFAGLFFAWLFYYKRPELPARFTAKFHGIYLTVLHKYYVDEGYGALFVKPLLALSTVVFWRGIDQGVIDGMVNGAGEASKDIGGQLRRMQSGNIRSYAAWVALGGAAVVAYMVWHSLTGVAK